MNIYESISQVMNEIDYIGKDKKSEQGYKYRGVDQVLNTLHPLFAKYKIFCVPEVLDIIGREDRITNKGAKVVYSILKVKYTFYAEDGSKVESVVVGEAMDSGDKSMNKCMAIAFKYACFQVLCIPTEETTADPDDENNIFDNHLTEREKELQDVAKKHGFTLSDVKQSVKEWFNKDIASLSDEEYQRTKKAYSK